MTPFPASRRPLLGGFALLLFAAASVRAQTPGDQDTTFATGPNANGSVFALALQPNGQVLAGGAFTEFRNAARNAVARLNPDGTLDAFSPGLGLTGYNGGTPAVDAIALQANGQIIVAGTFDVLGQTPGGGVARLNADGSVDATFNVGAGVVDDGGLVGQAGAVAVLSNGQVLVGGSFTSFDGNGVGGLVRLNADGSVDTTFNAGGAGVTFNGSVLEVKAIVVQPDGRILVGGQFTAYNGVNAGDIVRLNADGTLDTSFNAGAAATNDNGAQVVEALALQANGQILVGGTFNTFDGVSVPHLVRLNTDGSLDTSYDPANGVNINEVAAIVVEPDGAALVGGQVNIPEGLIYPAGDGLARIFADGTQDTGFASGGSDLRITSLALQPDGKALIAGDANGLTGGADGDVYRVFDVSPTPTVTIAPGAKKIYESGSKGPATFVVNISAAPASKLTVKYTLKGSALSGVDYEPVSGKVKIKPGHTGATISVYPKDRGIDNGSVVALKAVLLPGTGYAVGSPGTAKDKIIDNR